MDGQRHPPTFVRLSIFLFKFHIFSSFTILFLAREGLLSLFHSEQNQAREGVFPPFIRIDYVIRFFVDQFSQPRSVGATPPRSARDCQVRILVGGQNTTVMKKIINVQTSLDAILREYEHLSPDLPIGVFELRCRQIHIRLLKYINAHAPHTF